MSWRQPETTTQRTKRTQRRFGAGDTDAQRFLWSETAHSLCLSVSVAKLLCELPTLWVLLIGNGGDLPRVQRVEEVARGVDVEFRIGRLDAQEEPVAAGQREARHAEDRVIRHR